jgi:hypothetical protein
MALADLQAFLQERAAAFDPTLDLTSGSPFDVQVIQPTLRRLGSDPFSVDMGVFLQDRVNQEFPGLPTKEGDALTDLLIKPLLVLWDPLVRENYRVKQNLSFKDPTLLTLDEAEALGANLFAQRNKGNLSRVRARIYFAQPQNITITPANFISSKGQLNFFPTESQSISVQEMLFNKEGDLYYFDVNTEAQQPGDQYNIDPDQLVTIANVGAAVRVTNKLRARFGVAAETSSQFIDRVDQDLTERSLVTERGIIAKIGQNFSEVTRLAVTGFQDPEMQRDILTGGGLGRILDGGVHLNVVADGENKLASRRVQIVSPDVVDFTALIGPIGTVPPGTFTITIHSAFLPGDLPIVRDLRIRRVVATDTIDVEEQVLSYLGANLPWTLRKNELTLSGIPGGILFPDSPAGTISIPPGVVHIGGTTDIFVRGSGFDTASLLINSVVDDTPILQGVDLEMVDGLGHLSLHDLSLGVGGNYSVGDATYQTLVGAVGLLIEIRDPPIAGTYRIVSVDQSGLHPVLFVTPSPSSSIVGGAFRWRMLDIIDIDLAEPKETKIAGSDLNTTQGTNIVTTLSGVDFGALGVGANDVLRILSGALVVGDYTVVQVLSPFFTRIQVDRNLPATASGVQYAIFRSNVDGGISLPFVRVSSIDLLDTSDQPVGSKIPYARPVDIQSRSFANAAHGIKADFHDASLGIVSLFFGSGSFSDLNGSTIHFTWDGAPGGGVGVAFGPGTTNLTSVANQMNTAIAASTAGAIVRVAVVFDSNRRLGLLPVGTNTRVDSGTGSAMTTLFGTFPPYSSRDIRSATTNFQALRPALDLNFDVAQVVDGLQIGFYDQLTPDPGNTVVGVVDFTPETGRHVQIGSRSLGSARLFFLEPTTIEFGVGSNVRLTNDDGSFVDFIPDPTLTYQRIPALPGGVKPIDGVVDGAHNSLSSASSDFIKKGIMPGDLAVIDFIPLVGTAALSDPVTGLDHLIITLVVNGGTDKNVIFVRDSNLIPIGSVTRQGVADQINKAVGQIIAKIDGSNHLSFNPDASVIVRGTGTANATLGFPNTDSNNDSRNKGTYLVSTVTTNTLFLDYSTGVHASESNEQFKVFRKGLQRIIATTMSSQVAETGLYYFDLELISRGTGDQYNVGPGLQMTATGYKSDGYFVTTDDPNLTFSSVEKPRLHVSSTILEVGVSDDPDNATSISGQNIQVNYDRSILTGSVQNFVLSDTERVINESPLARHLIPYFVRTDLSYVGGSQPSVVEPDIETLILGLFPSDSLEVSDLEGILKNRGATAVDNPVNLLAVIHNFDRSVTMERSQNKLNTGRLAAFIPDAVTLTRKVQ